MGDVAFFEAPGLQQQMGTGTGKQKMVGVSDVVTGAVATVGAGEQTLLSSTLKANSLSENGKAVKIKAWGTAAGVAGAKTMLIKFGGANVAQAIIPIAVAANSWFLEVVIARTGAVAETFGGSGAIGLVASGVSALAGILASDTTADIAIAVTGNCANAADTIFARGLVVEFLN